MRKIESEMNAAIKSKINFSKANTSVSYDADNNESTFTYTGTPLQQQDLTSYTFSMAGGSQLQLSPG